MDTPWLVREDFWMPNPVLAPLELSEAERAELQSLAARRTTAQALALRARIVLACAEGGQNKAGATRLGLGRQTVGKWRQRFIEERLDGLHDEPRSGTPRSIDDARIEPGIARALESPPPDGPPSSPRAAAQARRRTVYTVPRIWASL